MRNPFIPLFAAGSIILVSIACSGPARAKPDSIARSMADATTRESKGDADRGKLLFRQLNCATCHSTNGDNGLGPTMKGHFDSEVQYTDGSSRRVDEKLLQEGIINPQKRIMSGYGPTMPPIDFQKPPRTLQDVDDLVSYIITLD